MAESAPNLVDVAATLGTMANFVNEVCIDIKTPWGPRGPCIYTNLSRKHTYIVWLTV